MPRHRTERRTSPVALPVRLAALTTVGIAAFITVGCASTEGERLSAGDFRVESDTASDTPPAIAPADAQAQTNPSANVDVTSLNRSPADRPPPSVRRVAERPSEREVLSIQTTVGTPAPTAIADDGGSAPSARDGESWMPTAKVGELNGRPVFSDTFLEDLRDKYTAERNKKGKTREAWRQEFKAEIKRKLETMLTDELLAAEGLASLKPEQRPGLAAWVEERAAEKVRQNRGSRTQMNQQLAQEGLNEQQFRKKEEARVLAIRQLNEMIYKKVRVTWRDVQRYYEREVRKPPEAVLRMINVDATNTEGIARITSALAAGEPFEKVARDPANTFSPEDGGLLPGTQVINDDLFDDDVMNEAVLQLKEGQWTHEPVEIKQRVKGQDVTARVWLFAESIRDPSPPLTDPRVQREIITSLERSKNQEEMQRYMGKLYSKGTFTNLDEMTQRLYEIAEADIWPLPKDTAAGTAR